jgi:hypothetical protein
LRQNAIARAGAAAYAMRGADDDTATTAIMRAAAVGSPTDRMAAMLPRRNEVTLRVMKSNAQLDCK